MSTATLPLGVQLAVEVEPEPVDLSALIYDPEQQLNLIRDGEVMVPALKHTDGKTATNTAKQDNAGGPDRDEDARED